MSMHYTYKTKGTCARVIDLDIDGDRISNVKFTGGCDGNLKAIPALVEGMTVDQIRQRVAGIKCGLKILPVLTSLPKLFWKHTKHPKKTNTIMSVRNHPLTKKN